MMNKIKNFKVTIKADKEYTFTGYYAIPGVILGSTLMILAEPIALIYKLLATPYRLLCKIF